jgi:formate C-acetyltransferase
MKDVIEILSNVKVSERVSKLRNATLDEPRYVTMEQACLITASYKEHQNESNMMKRAFALESAMLNIGIRIDANELVVGNRSPESCGGIVFPEGGIKWLEREIDILESRPQDQFLVRTEDRNAFFEEIVPFWEGKTLENAIDDSLTEEMKRSEIVGKLNQKDHAQGHICPDVKTWLALGPMGLLDRVQKQKMSATADKSEFYQAVSIVLKSSIRFIERYASLAEALAKNCPDLTEKEDYLTVARICKNLTVRPAETFHEAIQSVWFLFVLLELESNASSFSPGRADQYLFPYFEEDIKSKKISYEKAQELIDLMFIKFNQIVYLRNTKSAEFFAGFPIGFNITIGGKTSDNKDATNELTYIFLRAQEHIRMRQPNLSARIHKHSPYDYLRRVTEVIGIGTGMPQVVNDESIIPALENAGYMISDATNYAVVGCVELSVPGNALGFSDAAMFNMVKVLELTLNNGIDMLSGEQIGLPIGSLTDFKSYEELEEAFSTQLDYFVSVMEQGLKIIERYHKELMCSPLLSSVIEPCISRGLDVTAGGALYNNSGIQLIQVANLADSLAALKVLIYEEKRIAPKILLDQLRENFPDETIRQVLLNHAPKYGNDIEWVDSIGLKWVTYLKDKLDTYTNYRGGKYVVGLYTVSAHVPMGKNVAATPDGRYSRTPLADGGMSAMYGRDENGPTALLKSVSRIDSSLAGNGTLLNMKFSPSFFNNEEGIQKFIALLMGFIALKINHVQFNVFNKQDLLDAQKNPEKYRHLLVRVAGYTANYVDLSRTLQEEIIARTEYGV